MCIEVSGVTMYIEVGVVTVVTEVELHQKFPLTHV